jgi:hypothetical protein
MNLRKQKLFHFVVFWVGKGRVEKIEEVESSHGLIYPFLWGIPWDFSLINLPKRKRGVTSLEYTSGECCMLYVLLGEL